MSQWSFLSQTWPKKVTRLQSNLVWSLFTYYFNEKHFYLLPLCFILVAETVLIFFWRQLYWSQVKKKKISNIIWIERYSNKTCQFGGQLGGVVSLSNIIGNFSKDCKSRTKKLSSFVWNCSYLQENLFSSNISGYICIYKALWVKNRQKLSFLKEQKCKNLLQFCFSICISMRTNFLVAFCWQLVQDSTPRLWGSLLCFWFQYRFQKRGGPVAMGGLVAMGGMVLGDCLYFAILVHNKPET